MKRKALFLTIIAFIFISVCAPFCLAQEEQNRRTANDKFTRGIVNISTFYLEVPMTVYKTSKEENPITGLLYGLPVGIAKGAVRFVVGVVELGTFPFEPYEPLLDPEYLIIKE